MCDCEQPNPVQSDPNTCFTCGEPLSEKQMFDAYLGQSELIESLLSRIADLETIIEEIPNIGAVFGAVKELQETYDAPATKFVHYIGG